MKSKFYAALAAGTLALAGWSAAAAPARAIVLPRPLVHDSPPCHQFDVNCFPGSGWTHVQVQHGAGGLCVSSGGDNLDPIQVDNCSGNDFYALWWTRVINGGSAVQFTQEGNDGNFHDLGYSGGLFKLETPSASQYLVPWDESQTGAWTYSANTNPVGQFFMGDPGCVNCDVLENINPLTHWLNDNA